MIKSMTITNNRGDTFTFGRHFRLLDGFDLSNLPATVNYSDNTADGSNYNNTKLNNRDFDIGFRINKSTQDPMWIEEQRRLLFRVFNPKCNPFRIDFSTLSDEEFYLIANLEGVPSLPQDFANNNPGFQKGLLQFSSNDPYIYEARSKKVDIALWAPSFEFPLEVTEEGIELGYRSPSLIVNVNNSGQESTGMNIRFFALSEVVNPKLLNVNTYEELKLNFTMQPGDEINISTYRGKRSIILSRNNVKSNIFNTFDFMSSTFLQLEVGDNLFRYDADSGIDQLEVSMSYTPRRIGV